VSIKQKRLQPPTKSPMSLSGWRILAGKAVVQRLRSSGRRAVCVLVRGTQHVSMSADRSRRRPAWEKYCAMSRRARYCHGKLSVRPSVRLWHWSIVVT